MKLRYIFGIIAVVLVTGFLLSAGVVWVLCWALNAVGIHTIGGWTVQFSWPLVIIFIVVYSIIAGLFGKAKSDSVRIRKR